MKVLKLKGTNRYFVKVVRNSNSPFGRVVSKRNKKHAAKCDDVLVNGIKSALLMEFGLEFEVM